MFPLLRPLRLISQASALEKLNAFSKILRASSFVYIAIFFYFLNVRTLDCPPGIDYINSIEPGGRGAMGHGTGPGRLSLSVEEGSEPSVIGPIADLHTGIPEFLGIGLVGHILEHADDLPVLDLVEQCAAELEIITL